MTEVKSVEQLKTPYKNKKLSPLRAIKLHCKLECCVNDLKSWRDCTITDCFLWKYRFGTKKGVSKYLKSSSKQKHQLLHKENSENKASVTDKEKQEVLIQ